MSKYCRNIGIASEEALKSTQSYRHGAVITGKGGKVVATGYNKGNRTKVLNHIFTCVHAEMDAINKLINCVLIPKYGRHFKKHTNKFSIWIVRLENSPEIKYAYSKPCYYCSKLMKEYGFSKVYFTIDKETILTEKVCQLVPTHKSDCQVKSETVDTNIKFKLF